MNRKQEMQCIQEVVNGNMRSFSKLVDANKNYVFTLVVRMVKDDQIAEELTQDSFIKAYKSLYSFKSESKFTTWLYRIAYNTSLDYLKKSKIYLEDIDSASNVASDFQTGLDKLIEDEQSNSIKELINRLPKIDSLILSLYYFDEKTTDEIGKILDLKSNNIKQRLHRARKALSKKLIAHNITIEVNG
jgi:RNA polymerase sigma factor (sigma-70 family)